ncbi:MAG: YicC/YloC family endoribonuclease [Flavobacteriales bacterium]
MLRSMTGYGKAEGAVGSRKYTVEVRSLNGKNLDLSVRMPSVLKEKEMELRKQLGARIVRGKSDVAIHFEADAAEARHELNGPVIEKYVEALRTLAVKTDQPTGNLLSTVVRFPDAMQTSREAFDHKAWKGIHALVVEAADQFDAFRDTEGATLHADFSARLDTIDALEASLDPLLDARLKRVRERIRTNLEETVDRAALDEGRFEQEVLYYIEKMDVSEERTRLRAHIVYFRDIMNTGAAQGKKLGFVSQEMGREINTLGSKANDAELQRIVVQMKDELEKIKEQVLNVL